MVGASLTEAKDEEFEQVGSDPSGECGEYHIFVSAGPLHRTLFPSAWAGCEDASLSVD